MVCNDKKEKFGYYILEWIGEPLTGQETGQLMCDTVYWKSIPRAPFWYTHSFPLHVETHTLTNVIMTDLPLHAISENIPLPNGCAKDSATRKVQRKLLLNHMILSWLKYLGEKPLKMLTVETLQRLLVLVVKAAVVELVKRAAAVIVNRLSIP